MGVEANVLSLLLWGIPVGACAVTVTSTKVFAGWRAWLASRSTWWHGLFSCPYCFSHWMAFGVVGGHFTPTTLSDAFFSTFTIVWSAAAATWVVKQSFRSPESAEDVAHRVVRQLTEE